MGIGFFGYEVLVNNPALTELQLIDITELIYLDITSEPRVESCDSFSDSTKTFSFLIGSDLMTRADVTSLVHNSIGNRYGTDFILMEK